ncbi:hypothetical protein AB1M95_14820 [Sulfitobacter sp. LCG007]
MASLARSAIAVKELGSPDRVRLTAVAFASLGIATMLLPVLTGLPVERLLTLLLILWGSGGIVVAFTARRNVNRTAFLAVAICGLAAGFYYAIAGTSHVGSTAGVLAALFTAQGTLALALGLRLRGRVPAWGWLAGCGAFSILLAGVLSAVWPVASAGTFAAIVASNFLSTALALYRLSHR